MITFKPEVFAHHKRQDGTYNIKIRVTFNRQSRRIATSLYCTQADLTRSLKLKNGDLINKATDLCSRMRAACADLNIFDLEGRDVDWVVSHIKDSLKTESFHLDFFEFADSFLESKTDTTRRMYNTALKALERFIGERRLDINDITHSMLMDFMISVDSQKKMHYNWRTGEWKEGTSEKIDKASSTIYIMKLAHIFNAAKLKYNDEDSSRIVIPRSPFTKIHKVFPPANGQKNIGHEVMQTLISSQVDDQTERAALDAFILSFLLMGANLADLYSAVPFKGEWVYYRQKTRTRRADHAEMRVSLPPEAGPYIERLKGKGGWWLNVLHGLSEDKDRCSAIINRSLKKWCESHEVPVFTFYAARHTWASLARKAGVEKATIDEALCHVGEFDMADIYAERNWEIINEANRRVIDLFMW